MNVYFKKSLLGVALAVGIAGIATKASAQAGTGFTINDPDTFFTQGASPSGPAGATGTGGAGANMRLMGSASTDQLFQSWWWYRIDGVDQREFALANAMGSTFGGNMAVTTWVYPAFTMELTYIVQDNGVNMGRVRETMRITNTGTAALTMAVFNYTDFDLGMTPAGDSAVLGAGPQTIRIMDGSMFAELECPGANGYAVDVFPALRTRLANAGVDNLMNTGLPFSSEDFTAAFQWNVMLAAGASTVLLQEMRVNVAGTWGACCLAVNDCRVMNPMLCQQMGGTYQGDGTACAAGTCAPPVLGACCMGRCGCMQMTRAACEAGGGTYRGDGVACEPTACFARPACPCDWNGEGMVNSQDLFDFLSGFFDERADFNCDANTNSQDFFDFLGCLLSPPEGCEG